MPSRIGNDCVRSCETKANSVIEKGLRASRRGCRIEICRSGDLYGLLTLVLCHLNIVTEISSAPRPSLLNMHRRRKNKVNYRCHNI